MISVPSSPFHDTTETLGKEIKRQLAGLTIFGIKVQETPKQVLPQIFSIMDIFCILTSYE